MISIPFDVSIFSNNTYRLLYLIIKTLSLSINHLFNYKLNFTMKEIKKEELAQVKGGGRKKVKRAACSMRRYVGS